MVDAHENRDVGVADVTGAYLHAHMKDFISMRFTGWAVDLLCEVNPEYSPFAVMEGKTKVLYVRCNKAIYGCVVSGMLWYELFSQTLEKHGFIINPYDFCVANAVIDGTQCTIVWYVDDTKISHVKPSVVTGIIAMLESHFGTMSVSRGAKHEFLGMHRDFLGDGTATIHMPSYLQSAIDESNLPITKSAPTPAAASLLHIEAASPLLPQDRARTFHSVVAKLIYAGTRARTDILLALGFLCSRVSAPTEQDERKLFRLLAYLFGTLDLKFRLGADSLDSFTTWVDASFAVHGDMRSHTGGVISYGRGGLICKSKKQSINTKSSTEAELVGASDYLPNTLFVKMFMEAQGYPIAKAIFYQDNESAIKMESNGKASCGQRSRHIDICYFFITDHAKRQSVTIEHCPTGIMLADFFTKPLQGSLFRVFRSVLLGELPTSALSQSPSPQGNEERVDNGNPQPDPSGKPEPSGNQYRDTKIAVAATDASHSFETYPVSE
jgi:Reverse transcriptase (RNA-dependent DNA polymerase)